MEYIKLYNGVQMPTLGYGVFLVSPQECERCVSDADMAQIAQMNQHDAGTTNFGDPQFVKYLVETYG